MITWITALCNSVKLYAMSFKASQDKWVIVESSGKMWSTGEGNGKPLQHSCLENPMNKYDPTLHISRTLCFVSFIHFFHHSGSWYTVVSRYDLKKLIVGTSLVVQWLRVCLPMQGSPTESLVRGDTICHSTTNPVCCNYI